jgi:hypothetical protein
MGMRCELKCMRVVKLEKQDAWSVVVHGGGAIAVSQPLKETSGFNNDVYAY